MGSSNSTPPPALLDKPWMEIDWGRGRENDLQFINSYKPEADGQQQFRILLHGPVGAGKSSFINSVMSALEGKMRVRATTCNINQGSFTKEYKTYTVKGNQGEVYPLVLNDMTGLTIINQRHRRVHVKDVKKAMKGHIRDGYTFNPEKSLSKTDPFYKSNPTINDKVHILVSVFDAGKVNLLGEKVYEIIQEIRDEATDLGIPHVAILTKIDEACPKIKENVGNVCRSRPLWQKVLDLSRHVGIPENCIFPVKNYHLEKSFNNNIDALILNTLKHIVQIGD